MKSLAGILLVVGLLLGVVAICANGARKSGRPGEEVAVVAGVSSSKNTTRAVVAKNSTKSASAPQATSLLEEKDFFELNNKMLPSAKLTRNKRQTRVIVERSRPRKLGGRRRPSFLPPPPPRLPPIAKRRRFPKPPKSKYRSKPPKGSGPVYGPPIGYFLMNNHNEIVHKSKDLVDIPPQYLDKIIPPNFINGDSPPNIYALEHDDGPPLGLGESKEVQFSPTNSYGLPVQPQLEPYYPYPPSQQSPTIESNNVPQQSESRPLAHNNQFNSFNRGQSETQQHNNPEQLPPVVYHPPFKKAKKKKKRPHHQPASSPIHHEEFALQPDPVKNTYGGSGVSSYDAPLSYVPAASSSIESSRYPVQIQQQKVRPLFNVNVGQSFVESYAGGGDSNEHDPPPLPTNYNQNDFSGGGGAKSKPKHQQHHKQKHVVYEVNTSYEDLDSEDHGLALEYPPVSDDATEAPHYNFGARQKKKRPPHAKKKPPPPSKYDFIDSYEDSSISQEVYHTSASFTRPATVRSTSTPPTTRYYRTRSTTKDPLFEILDTEDLRTAFQSGRHRYKLANANRNKEPDNFVLLASKNPQPNTYHPRMSTRSPFGSGSSNEDFSGVSKRKPSGHSFAQQPDHSQERPSAETDFESYEVAERDFGLRKRDFNVKRKSARKESRADTMKVEKIEFSDGRRSDDFVKATTMRPAYSRFNPDVQFTKTFSSKIEQPPKESSGGLWNGQPIPGNHKVS